MLRKYTQTHTHTHIVDLYILNLYTFIKYWWLIFSHWNNIKKEEKNKRNRGKERSWVRGEKNYIILLFISKRRTSFVLIVIDSGITYYVPIMYFSTLLILTVHAYYILHGHVECRIYNVDRYIEHVRWVCVCMSYHDLYLRSKGL